MAQQSAMAKEEVEFDDADTATEPAGTPNPELIMQIPVEVQVVLGRTQMPVASLMALSKGSTIALDRRVGEPVDLIVNGRKIGRGEITVLEDDETQFGIKLTELATGKPGE